MERTAKDGPAGRWDGWRPWFAVFVGPLSWAADFALSFSLTRQACAAHSSGSLLLFSAVAFGATLAGLMVAVRARRKLRAAAPDVERFLATAGIASSGGFLLAIAAAAIPRLIVDPCI